MWRSSTNLTQQQNLFPQFTVSWNSSNVRFYFTVTVKKLTKSSDMFNLLLFCFFCFSSHSLASLLFNHSGIFFPIQAVQFLIHNTQVSTGSLKLLCTYTHFAKFPHIEIVAQYTGSLGCLCTTYTHIMTAIAQTHSVGRRVCTLPLFTMTWCNSNQVHSTLYYVPTYTNRNMP